MHSYALLRRTEEALWPSHNRHTLTHASDAMIEDRRTDALDTKDSVWGKVKKGGLLWSCQYGKITYTTTKSQKTSMPQKQVKSLPRLPPPPHDFVTLSLSASRLNRRHPSSHFRGKHDEHPWHVRQWVESGNERGRVSKLRSEIHGRQMCLFEIQGKGWNPPPPSPTATESPSADLRVATREATWGVSWLI